MKIRGAEVAQATIPASLILVDGKPAGLVVELDGRYVGIPMDQLEDMQADSDHHFSLISSMVQRHVAGRLVGEALKRMGIGREVQTK